jgi:hypothetical protein
VPFSAFSRNSFVKYSRRRKHDRETKPGCIRAKSWASDINFGAYLSGAAATSSVVVRSSMESSRSVGDGPCPEELGADCTAV